MIVCIKRGVDRDRFLKDMASIGVELTPIPGLLRHFTTQSDAVAFENHQDVESIDDDETTKQPPEAITLDALLHDGSWATARSIRRDAPWNVDHVRHPYETYYRCERDGDGVDVYVVDSGIDTDHPEFNGRASNVYEFASSGGLGDDFGHGTLVASAAAGLTAGFARSSLVWSFKSTTSSAGGNTNASLITTLGQLLTHYEGRSDLNRPAVVNLSVSPTHSTSVGSAVSDLIDAGMVCVLSAGNEMDELASTPYPLPFSDDDLIVAGGTGIADIPYFHTIDGTNYGLRVDIVAPGQALRTAAAAVRGVGYYETRRGTSISCPYVSGVIACMLQGHNRLSTRTQVQAVRTKLLANATSGRLRSAFGLWPLPDKILYLDPDQVTPEVITGL